MEFNSIPHPTNLTHKRIPNPPKSKSPEIHFIPANQTDPKIIGKWFEPLLHCL